ncbi:MAG: hypothetical protein IJ174_02805, partial [Clostridia bacterium]|nr:hypothetical protein [Clostridia bacterium]
MSEIKSTVEAPEVKLSERKNTPLPYLQGGIPRAVLYCLWIGGMVSAAFSALFAVLNWFTNATIIVKVISTAGAAFSIWLTLKESLGARKLLRSLHECAYDIGKVLSIRRVLLIIVLVIFGIYILIAAFASRSGGFLFFLISAGIGALLFVPFYWLTTDEIALMEA